jgi:exonuclease VII small subunit
MNSQPRIPDAETRARSVANLRALVKRMDAGILQLDELIASLEADIRNSPLTAYRLGKAKRTIEPKESSQ